MEEQNPLVSIIVRTKDRPKLLRRALKSIAEQTYRPLEVVLVNDGGCDLDIEEFKDILSDVPLTYMRLQTNMGRANAGNVGIEKAKGKFIGFLDDDDVLRKGHVDILAHFLNQSDVGVAYTDSVTVKNGATMNGYVPISSEAIYNKEFDRDLLLFQNYIPFNCLMIRRELLESEGFDISFDLFEDWDLLIRLSRLTSFQRIPEVTAEYHLRSDNTVGYLNPQTYPHIEARYRVYRKHMNLISERSFYIFEYLHSEKERFREICEQKKAELESVRAYLGTLEKELNDAKQYSSEKEDEVRRSKEYTKGKEEELIKVSSLLRDKEEELFRMTEYIREMEKEVNKTRKRLAKFPPPVEGMVSIVILTFNGERYIKNLLDCLVAQESDLEREIIVIDSSSDDSTCRIVRDYDAKLHIIDRGSFSHPGTRNLGAKMAQGRYIVFLTQDALPVGPMWLGELLRPFEFIPGLAASYSRQIPRPYCNPLEARDIYIGAPCVDEIRYADFSSGLQADDYKGNMHRYIRFSNVSTCYLGELLRDNPFDERLPMVEDQEWSKRMIEKGYSVYYASKSMVLHSHDYGFRQIYRRHFDYGRSFKFFLSGHPPRRLSALKATLFDSANDLFFVLNDNRRLRSKLKWISLSPLRRFAGNYGLYRGWKHG
jgi:glycosyltransferase involved in cell wall biosynthesis